jgi:hypothetical protein
MQKVFSKALFTTEILIEIKAQGGVTAEWLETGNPNGKTI